MALRRRNPGAVEGTVWPGFVDSMTSLLLVLMFVLTIFTVVQFVLSDTISGQASELDNLTAQVANLTDALGLSEERAAGLSADLTVAAERETAAQALIARLGAERDRQAADLADASARITAFEAQVAGLLADRDTANARIAGLEGEQTRLLTEAEALNTALAAARSEIDAGQEAARLAAARADAMQALIASLRADQAEQAAALDAAQAQRLLDAAAADALRTRLSDAEAELTAMTLSLEQQRAEAERTLTLLAAANAARDDLDLRLAAALATVTDLETDLSAAADEQQSTLAQLTAALAAQQAAEAQAQTMAADLARADTETAAQLSDLTAQLATVQATREQLERDLAAAILARETDGTQAAADLAALEERLLAAQATADTAQDDADRQAALLAVAENRLSEEEALSADSLRQVAALNAQVAQLRAEIGSLQDLLNLADAQDAARDVQIESLTEDLNQALARAAAQERRARLLEEAEAERLRVEAERLAAEAQDLERYRSEFFGRLRDVVAGQDGIRIEGDRFVFSSEVLFAPGSADLSPEGAQEIGAVAALLRQIAAEIPDGIDWIIRVDGHTDNVPLSGQGEFTDNWELSQARALSVVRYMIANEGIAPERLAANGFGEFQPLNPADTPEARAQNRRIELKLTER